MHNSYKLLFSAKGKGRLPYYLLCVLCGLVFLWAYKLTVGHLFSGPELMAEDSITHYGGVKIGELSEYIQTGKETCGQAALAFFLTSIGFPETEASIIDETGTGSMLSLADMDRAFTGRGLKTQLLKVEPGYFRKHPETAILHFSENHFVVFLREENGEPMIFDPAYGKVYVPWKVLFRLFSGYMLYIYT
jgi:hypothetical protein